MVNRQTALLALDVLARSLGGGYPDKFDGLLQTVTIMVQKGEWGGASDSVGVSGRGSARSNSPLTSTAFLLVATLCAVLGPKAFPCLPRFFPPMLDALEQCSAPADSDSRKAGQAMSGTGAGAPARGAESGSVTLLQTSALSAVATVAASLPAFLHPYLGRILPLVLGAAGGGAQAGAGTGVASGVRHASDRVLTLLAVGVEARLLIPAVSSAYDRCSNEGEAPAVARLLVYVREVVTGLKQETVSTSLPQLMALLTRALDFRRLHAPPSDGDSAGVDLVDTEATEALLALVMRLSEAEMRPLFIRLCEWKSALGGGGKGEEGEQPGEVELGELDRKLSFYRVLDGLSGVLKSIFTPYFAYVLEDCRADLEAATQLGEKAQQGDHSEGTGIKRRRGGGIPDGGSWNKRSKKRRKSGSAGDEGRGSEEADAGNGNGDGYGGVLGGGSGVEEAVWYRRMAMARLVLSSLRKCFTFDRAGFVNKKLFDILQPALVAHLECHAAAWQHIGCPRADGVGGGGGDEEVRVCRKFANDVVAPCLAQLAAASGKDAMWKGLAHGVLLRSRSDRAGVRVASLVTLRRCFDVVGEEFLSLLPECLPFLSELLEDGHPEVERECRGLVKYIEEVLGESIESYLS
ncbi:unnamed protein product [Discosporangium mesarthrocarpum]